MKKLALLLFPMLILMGCTTSYYLVVSNEPTEIYSSNKGSTPIIVIPGGSNYITVGKSSMRFTQWGSFKGYSRKSSKVLSQLKLSAVEYSNLVYVAGVGYINKDYVSSRSTPASSNGSRSSGSTTRTSSSSGGTVHVKGYTRKDGTYVRPHTRSAPRRH